MKIKQLSETTAGAVASVAMPLGKTHKRTEEAANPAQQAAIAVNMKKAGKKPKNVKEGFSKDEITAAVKDYIKQGGEVVQGKKSKGPRKPGLSLASKHIGGGGDKMRPSRTGRGSNPLGKAIVAVEDESNYVEINPKSFLDDDFYAFDPETKVLKGTWSHKSVGRRHHEYEAQQKGYEVVSGMKAKHLGLVRKQKQVDEGGFDIPEIPRAPTPKPPADKNVKEGMFGLDEKTKAKIQNIAVEISDIPGYWDWERDTFTPYGILALEEALGDKKYVKYALSLTADDDYAYEDVAEGSFKQTPGQRQYGALHTQLRSLANSGQINTPDGKQKAEKMIDTIQQLVDTDPSCAGSTVPSKKIWLSEQGVSEDWQKVNRKDKTSGMSSKAVKAYRRENPGSKLKTAVTTKPSKLKRGSKAAKRRKSFCARMSGMKKAHASAKTKRNPDSPINKALRRWNCESIEDMRNLIENAERMIAEEKKRLDPKCWDGYKKQGTKMKGGVRVNNCVPVEEGVAEENKGLYYNVQKKRERIKHGSGERMRKPGTKGAPSAQAWRDAAKTAKTESNIMRGMVEAHISEEELLLAPGQGVRFKTELMPKRTDHEVEMARNQLRSSFENAKHIYQNIKDLSEIQGLDGWVQAKITKASDYLEAVNQYLDGKKQMIEKEIEVAEDQIEDRLTAQYNTPQAKAQSQAIDQAFASGNQADFDRMGIMSPQQIERDYQAMRAKEPAQDAAVYANPKLTPSARTVQRYNPKGVPIREIENQEFDDRSPHDTYIQSRTSLTSRDGVDDISKRVASLSTDRHGNQRVRAIDTNRDLGDEVTINAMIPKGVKAKIVPQQGSASIEETAKLSAREKFKRGLKRAGYDPDAGADRLLRLIARQAEERKEFERKQKEQDEEFYKNRIKENEPAQPDNQQEQPKSNRLFDVLKGIGDIALPVGRAIYGMQGRDIPADLKSDVKTMIRNKVTGEPNK
jgi:hypothetical protein